MVRLTFVLWLCVLMSGGCGAGPAADPTGPGVQADVADVETTDTEDPEVEEDATVEATEVQPSGDGSVDPCASVTCDNEDPCDGLEICDPTSGVCVGGVPMDCDDTNPCTADGCDPAGGCTHEDLLDGTPCGPDDTPGLAGQCAAGTCVLSGSCDCVDDSDCDDGSPCTLDTCQEATCECWAVPISGPCMDLSNPWEVVIHYPNTEETPEGGPSLQSVMVPVPVGATLVQGQIAVRGDLDYFPAAFLTLMVEAGGSLTQCGDVSGMPQLPNNILDDIYRVAWPRPANLAPSSMFYPPSPPYDFQALPCQEAFLGKGEVEVGIIAVNIQAPGVSTNQGPTACGGPGCPNDTLVTLRFEPAPDGPSPCEGGKAITCICGDGSFGQDTCEIDGSGPVGDCVCAEGVAPPEPPVGSTLGLCEDPLPFSIGPIHTEALVVIQGSDFHTVPWPPVESACPTSKPPFSIEHFYEMEVTASGHLLIEVELVPEPWSPNQFWIDMQVTCQIPWQCGASYQPMEGDAEAGIFLVGITLAPPEEVYIPEQGDWEMVLKVTWSPPTE